MNVHKNAIKLSGVYEKNENKQNRNLSDINELVSALA